MVDLEIKAQGDNRHEITTLPRRISVVVCAHNEERTIKACLASIFRQTLKPHEVIVVLDRCTDKTPFIVASFQQHLKIIEKKISHWKNSYTENLELARNCASGDVYAIIDGDVCLSRDYFEKTTELLKSAEIVLVSGRIVFCSANPDFLSRVARLWEDLLWISPTATSLFYGCSLLVKTQFLNNIGGFRDVPAPDTYLQQQAYSRKFKHKFVKDTVAFHFDEDLSLREIISRQIELGKHRRAIPLSFIKTVLFATLRLKPFTISGWLSVYCNEKNNCSKQFNMTSLVSADKLVGKNQRIKKYLHNFLFSR